VPKALIDQDVQRPAEMTRQDMAQRGMNVADMPSSRLNWQFCAAGQERRARLDRFWRNWSGRQRPAGYAWRQVRTQVEEIARSYEDPQQVLEYYFGDRQRLAEVVRHL